MEIEDLILSGAVEPSGLDPETGEMLYTFTDKLQDISPMLHTEIMNRFEDHMMHLWELGMVSMNITQKNPVVRLTKKAFDEELINSLDEEISFTLKEIKRRLVTE